MKKVVIEAKIKRPIWDYLFYASMLVLTIWLVLKVIGIIKTPVWLEYGVPIGSAILAFSTFFQSINDKIAKLLASDARLEAILMHHDKDLERIKDALFH